MRKNALREQLDRAFGENGHGPATPPIQDHIREGARNAALTSIAGALRRRGATQDEIASCLEVFNERCETLLEARELQAIARSVSRYEPDSFLSDALDSELASEREFPFLTAREIAEATPERVPWVAPPWAARGALTELSGKAKAAGKTTFLMALVRNVLDGTDFMGEPTERGPVVYLTEERPTTFREALGRAGLLNREDLYVLSYSSTIGAPWPEVARQGVAKCLEVGAVLFVVDTVSQFANLRGEEEQASGHALEAVAPLQQAAAQGVAVIGIRHERKAGGEVGQSARGSTAFAGAADIVLRLSRGDGNTRPSARIIHAIGRFDETPETLVIDLTEDGFVALGSETDVAVQSARRALLETLPRTEQDAVPEAEVLEALPQEVKRTSARKALHELRQEGVVTRHGKGRRGDAYRYSQTVDVSDTTPLTKSQKETKGDAATAP